MPYFLRHYGRFADRIVVFDNESDDRTVDLVRSCPKAEVRSFGTGGTLRDDVHRDIKNHDWKESRGEADWVVVVDLDEFLWHRDLTGYLRGCRERGVTVPVPVAYEMLAEAPPSGAGQIYEEIAVGAPEPFYAKLCLFDPAEVREIRYGAGCHAADPVGNVVFGRSAGLKLLHFRFLGDDWIRDRWRDRAARLSAHNRRMGWGLHYLTDAEGTRRWVAGLRARSARVV